MDSNQNVDETSPTPRTPDKEVPAAPVVASPIPSETPSTGGSPAFSPLPAELELPLGSTDSPASPEPPAGANEAPASSETSPSAAPASATPQGSQSAFDPAALATLAEQAAGRRLPAADEVRATDLIVAGLVSGKDDVVAVAAALPAIGWTAGVKGVTTGWPQMKATARTAFIKAIGADENEPARRIRLSLARGLYTLDPAVCMKLTLGVAKEIRDKKSGEMAPKDAQTFAAVMIGKGKPWISQLPLAEQKPADADALIHCAIIAAFTTNNPPVTQLGVLKWAAEAGRLNELHETALAAVTKAVARWSPRWAAAARSEVPNLPETIASALKPETPRTEPEPQPSGLPPELEAESTSQTEEGEASGMDEAHDDGTEPDVPNTESEAPKPKGRPVYVSKTIPPRDQPPQQRQREREQREPRDQQPQQQRGPGPKAVTFNSTEALRQVESHIVWLKMELQAAEKRSRVREERPKRPDAPVIEGEPTPEELARLNIQLEARITELQARIDDLTADAEARATSRGAFVDGPAPDPGEQLRALLGMKLRDYYADFCALEKEDRDLVIPQHYRTVLGDVFEVLKAEAIPFEELPAS